MTNSNPEDNLCMQKQNNRPDLSHAQEVTHADPKKKLCSLSYPADGQRPGAK